MQEPGVGMDTIQRWTGADACRLQAAYRMSNEDFAGTLGVASRTVAGWHEREQTVPRHEMQRALDVLLERADNGVLTRFRAPSTIDDQTEQERAPLAIRSHKFVTAYLGPAQVEKVRACSEPQPRDDLIGGHLEMPLPHPAGPCSLHLWAHGVAIAHLVEEPAVASLSELAAWRYRTYPENLRWLAETLAGLCAGDDVESEYVLSAYWVRGVGWASESTDRAVKIACMPRVLCGDQAHADDDAESRLLREGFDHPDLTPFGVAGAGIGYASWSGVAYAPLDDARALPEAQLVDVELPLQAVWTYCARIAAQVERGHDPDLAPEFGWRWLRGARSRLLNPRPQETNTHRTMREAIVTTAGLPALISDAINALREADV